MSDLRWPAGLLSILAGIVFFGLAMHESMLLTWPSKEAQASLTPFGCVVLAVVAALLFLNAAIHWSTA